MDVVVTGIGLHCCLGSLLPSWQRLLRGESGIKVDQPFPELSPRPLGLIGNRPVNLSELTQETVAMAVEDAGLMSPLPDCGVVIGSSRSYQGIWEELARESLMSSSTALLGNWLEWLPHQMAIATARQIGATGPVLAPMAACATGIWAIAQGYSLIQNGQCQQVIAGAVESPITPLTLAGFDKMGALAKTGCYPFDTYREGLVLGEGGAIFVLESAEFAFRRGASIYGKILGFGFTCDAYHMSAPASTGKTAALAIKQCCDRASLIPRDINYIHTHGTSTQLNDRNEAQLIQSLFPETIPVSSTKGATGHTLGASGAIAAAFSLMTLKDQILPPCVGLKEPEFDLNFVRKADSANIENVLCFSFGFGGQNAVMAFGK
ncbi:MAG: beta-ketoacyl-ACP synthase [Cyanobacteriota bacterium]